MALTGGEGLTVAERRKNGDAEDVMHARAARQPRRWATEEMMATILKGPVKRGFSLQAMGFFGAEHDAVAKLKLQLAAARVLLWWFLAAAMFVMAVLILETKSLAEGTGDLAEAREFSGTSGCWPYLR